MCFILSLRIIVKHKSFILLVSEFQQILNMVLGGCYLLRGDVIYKGITTVLG